MDNLQNPPTSTSVDDGKMLRSAWSMWFTMLGQKINDIIKQLNTVDSSKKLAQIVTYSDGAYATTASNIPADNTIPQITEGGQFLSATITPTSALSTLEITVNLFGSENTNVADAFTVALFRDGNVNAIAAGQASVVGLMSGCVGCSFTHYVAANSLYPTTFTVRAGLNTGAGLFAFNGISSAGQMGGTMASRITIKEYLP
jgi:hypothetical protein